MGILSSISLISLILAVLLYVSIIIGIFFSLKNQQQQLKTMNKILEQLRNRNTDK
jgi:uncharacterized protein YneF (UPF0154 family)